MEKRTKKFNISWVIAGVCIAVLTIGVMIWQARFGMTVQYPYDSKYSFLEGQSDGYAGTNGYWPKGDVYYGVYQDYGNASTTYDLMWKKNSGSYILEWSNGYVKQNKYYQGAWYMHYTTGWDKYTYYLHKDNYLSTKSYMIIPVALK